jgi:signal transduction histidine kinase
MSVSTKVMLFAVVAISATALMGAAHYRLASQGRLHLERLVAVQEQSARYASLKSGALDLVDALLLAHKDHGAIWAMLAEYEQRSRQDFERVRELKDIGRETSDSAGHSPRRELLDQLQSEHQQWLTDAKTLASGDTALPRETLPRELLARFTQKVDPPLQQLWAAQHDHAEQLKRKRLSALARAERIAVVGPLLSLVIVIAFATAILRPMNSSLQVLVKGAERLGQGGVEYKVPEKGHDEFSTLARALNRMAAQLRGHSTLLEETVRTRTAELESSNAQLNQSLQRLRAIQEQLLFSERLATIGQIAGSISHEINNPLAFIISNLTFSQEALKRTQGALSEEECQEVQEALAEASDGAERVRTIVQDLKMLLHPGTIERSPMDLAAAIRTAMKMAAHEIRHRARLVEQLDGIPEIHGNSARLTQVFLNLLINAAHSIPPGQVERNEIRINAQVCPPGHVIVKVSDTGSGIPPEHVKRIFDPFFTTKPQGMGSGLGLSVCHSIITAHSGEISVESEVGRGTTFQIVLPLAWNVDRGQNSAQRM